MTDIVDLFDVYGMNPIENISTRDFDFHEFSRYGEGSLRYYTYFRYTYFDNRNLSCLEKPPGKARNVSAKTSVTKSIELCPQGIRGHNTVISLVYRGNTCKLFVS